MARRGWRLLRHGPAPGWWNMAVDEALLEAATRGTPSVRLYAWSGPWLSLGHAQALAPARAAACDAAGVGVVRRVTGGRAVLHGADLTYALAAPAGSLPAGLLPSYRLVGRALLAALQAIGVAAEAAAPAAGPGPPAFDCFVAPGAEEICAGGRKLAGSAQRRRGGALLQHGSIRLAGDPPEAAAAAGLGREATSLALLGVPPARAARLPEALVEALRAALGAALEPAELAPEELAAVRQGAARLRKDPLGRRFSAPYSVSRGPLNGRYE